MAQDKEEVDLSIFQCEDKHGINSTDRRNARHTPSNAILGLSDTAQSITLRRAAPRNARLTTERFFEICFDNNITVLKEEDFERGEQTGNGPSAFTCRGLLRKSSKAVAVKYIKASLSSGIRPPFGNEPDKAILLDKLLLELQILSHSKLRGHENIQDLVAVSWRLEFSPGSQHVSRIYPVIITDLVSQEESTLAEVLTLSGSVPFSLRLELLRDVIEGLTAVRGLESVSADIQPQNVLLFDSSTHRRIVAKLASFRWRRSQQLLPTAPPAHSYWAAPECLPGVPEPLQRLSRSAHSDVYTFGLVASFVLTQEAPFAQVGEDPGRVYSFKLQNKVSDLVASRWRQQRIPPSEANQPWEFLHEGQWCVEDRAPGAFLNLLPQLVQLRPGQRPELEEARAALAHSTHTRTHIEHPNQELVPFSMESSRRYVDAEFWQLNPELGDISPQSPLPFKQQLHGALQSRLQKNLSSEEKQKVLTLIGDFFLQAFNSSQALNEASKWYMLAAKAGSAEAMAIMFRFERLLQKSIPDLDPDINPELRCMWLIECMVGRIRKHFDPSLNSRVDIVDAFAKLTRLLSSDAWFTSLGLWRDLDESVVRLRSYTHQSFSNWKSVRGGLDRVIYKDIISALQNDDAQTLDKLIQTPDGAVFAGPLLLEMAVDVSAVKIIYLLASKYRYDLNSQAGDSDSAAHGTLLTTAAMRSDVAVFTTLLACGADPAPLMARSVMDNIVRHGSDRMLREALNVILSRGENEPIQQLFGTVNMSHQVLDGICLAMRFMHHDVPSEIPPDNSNPPPLFEAISFNRIEKIQSLLSRGANPNVFAQGFSALSLAVRMCRPMAVLLLLAFGADPNVRNAANGYGTPLHDLSDSSLKVVMRKEETRDEYHSVDFIGRPFEPLPEKDDSDNIRRRLILQALLDYGAQTNVLSIEGFTPLMVAIASPSDHALNVVKQFVQVGVSLTETSLTGETALHLAVLADNDLALDLLLEGSSDTPIVNVQNDGGATALFLAVSIPGRDEIIDRLLAANAEISIRGPEHLTALDVALVEGRIPAMMKLLQHMEKMPPGERSPTLEACADNGRSVFHYVSLLTEQEVQVEVTSMLLSWLSEPRILITKDKTNLSALDFAKHGNAPMVVKLFQAQLQTHSIRSIERKPSGIEKQTFEKEVDKIRSFHKIEVDVNERQTSHAEFCRVVLEETGSEVPGQVNLTKVEVGSLKMLDCIIAERCPRDPLTFWCMNNLGTVYERYGRLERAQQILYNGWGLAREILGPDSMLTHDFACKVLRVIKCRGLHDIDGLDVAKWLAEHGRETLRSFFSIVSERDYKQWEAEQTRSAPGVDQTTEVRMCDRDRCGKIAAMSCPDCTYAQYCSETCLANDIMDPNSDHLAVCFPTDALHDCPATTIRLEALRESTELISRCWLNMKKNFSHLENIPQPPPVQDVTQIDLNPTLLKKGVAFTLRENTALVFLNYDFCEVKVMTRPPHPWKKLIDMNIFMAIMDVTIWLRPTIECAEGPHIHRPFMALVHFQGGVGWLTSPNDRPGSLNTNITPSYNSTEDFYMSGARSPEGVRLPGWQPLSNTQSLPVRVQQKISGGNSEGSGRLQPGTKPPRSQVPQMNRISSSPANLQVNMTGQAPKSRLKRLFSKQPG